MQNRTQTVQSNDTANLFDGTVDPVPCIRQTSSEVPYRSSGVWLNIIGSVHSFTTQLDFTFTGERNGGLVVCVCVFVHPFIPQFYSNTHTQSHPPQSPFTGERNGGLVVCVCVCFCHFWQICQKWQKSDTSIL